MRWRLRGGGLTYLRNVVPHLVGSDLEVTVLAGKPQGRHSSRSKRRNAICRQNRRAGNSRPFLVGAAGIPKLIRKAGADVLLSTGNFAIWNSPVPQILLSRNSLYTSTDFSRDLRRRCEYGLWADTWLKGFLARQSIQRAH